MDSGPRWVYGFVVGAFAGPVGLWAALAFLWAYRAAWWEAPNGDDLQYFGLMCGLTVAGAVFFIPASLLGGWVLSRRGLRSRGRDLDSGNG